MIFPRPFRDPTKRGIVRACDDHCDIAAAKRLEHLAGFPWVQILMNVFSDSQAKKTTFMVRTLCRAGGSHQYFGGSARCLNCCWIFKSYSIFRLK
ncbi:uncharacterized protein LOC126616301 isoform X3 [Malus sylvestris]|uniref:uncharacterized protein LOC126616301 isoform X3 n=1 Tax=Malus sylvestris TaxID=3752 RepID=UPI0021AC2464|nr:uncharacterized protein LOC126616301 isoform X3 [Malus sylvestris]